jgi:fatty acid desaturase
MSGSPEKQLRKKVIACFDKAEFKSFHELRPDRVIWTFAHIWLGIAAAVGVGLWAWRSDDLWPWLLIPLLVFYIGTRQNAIAVQIHEAAHNLLFSRRSLNDAFCNCLGAYWILNDTASYRRVHLVHHTDLHLESDPDRDLYELSLTDDRLRVTRLIFQDLMWITALRRILAYLRPRAVKGTASAPGQSRLHTVAKLGAQGVLLGGACFALGWLQGALFYLVFWVIPLFSIFPAIIRLRIVTEHFSPASRLLAPGELSFVCRTTCTHPVEIYLFGCDMEYHFEHHLLPAIPHPQLARLHRALVERKFFEELPPGEDYLSGGYLRFWSRLLRGKVPATAAVAHPA